MVQSSQTQEVQNRVGGPASEIDDPLLQDLIEPLWATPRVAHPESGNRSAMTGEHAEDSRHGPAMQADASDPGRLSPDAFWQRIVVRMQTTERRIAVHDVSPETCRVQDEILKELDWIIQRVEQQQTLEQGKAPGATHASQAVPLPEASASRDTTPPPQDSDRMPAPGASPDVHPIDPLQMARQLIKKTWGHLPERKRESLLIAPEDQFLPKYERLIEDYYQRLSRQRLSP